MTDDQLQVFVRDLVGETSYSVITRRLIELHDQVRDQVTAERNPGEKIFTHKHLDFACVEYGCQSLFLEEARKRIVDLEGKLSESERIRATHKSWLDNIADTFFKPVHTIPATQLDYDGTLANKIGNRIYELEAKQAETEQRVRRETLEWAASECQAQAERLRTNDSGGRMASGNLCERFKRGAREELRHAAAGTILKK